MSEIPLAAEIHFKNNTNWLKMDSNGIPIVN